MPRAVAMRTASSNRTFSMRRTASSILRPLSRRTATIRCGRRSSPVPHRDRPHRRGAGHAFRQHGAGRQPVRVAAQAFYPRVRRGSARSVFPGGGAAAEGVRIRKKYAPPAARDAALAALRDYWDEKCAALQIDTPNEGMNTLINIWTLYQSEINVQFSRFASFIEVGGRHRAGATATPPRTR